MKINLKSEIIKTVDNYIDDPLRDIAEKHQAPMELIELMLEWGIGVELEHISEYEEAKELVLSRLMEDVMYYKYIEELK